MSKDTHIEILYTPHFLRMYAKLNSHIQTDTKKKIKLFTNVDKHKSLKVHKLNNLENTYSFSVNHKIRIVFEYGKNKNTVHLLYIGSHDEVY